MCLRPLLDRAGERVYLIDEQAREIPVEQALLLYLSLIASSGRTGKLAFPVTVTSHVDRLIEGTELGIIRTRASLPELTLAAAEEGDMMADHIITAGAAELATAAQSVARRLGVSGGVIILAGGIFRGVPLMRAPPPKSVVTSAGTAALLPLSMQGDMALRW